MAATHTHTHTHWHTRGTCGLFPASADDDDGHAPTETNRNRPRDPPHKAYCFLKTKIFQQILQNSLNFIWIWIWRQIVSNWFFFNKKKRIFFDDEQLKYNEKKKEIPENIPRFRAATRNGGGTYLLMIYDARRFFFFWRGKDGGFGSLCGSLITFSYRRRWRNNQNAWIFFSFYPKMLNVLKFWHQVQVIDYKWGQFLKTRSGPTLDWINFCLKDFW